MGITSTRPLDTSLLRSSSIVEGGQSHIEFSGAQARGSLERSVAGTADMLVDTLGAPASVDTAAGVRIVSQKDPSRAPQRAGDRLNVNGGTVEISNRAGFFSVPGSFTTATVDVEVGGFTEANIVGRLRNDSIFGEHGTRVSMSRASGTIKSLKIVRINSDGRDRLRTHLITEGAGTIRVSAPVLASAQPRVTHVLETMNDLGEWSTQSHAAVEVRNGTDRWFTTAASLVPTLANRYDYGRAESMSAAYGGSRLGAAVDNDASLSGAKRHALGRLNVDPHATTFIPYPQAMSGRMDAPAQGCVQQTLTASVSGAQLTGVEQKVKPVHPSSNFTAQLPEGGEVVGATSWVLKQANPHSTLHTPSVIAMANASRAMVTDADAVRFSGNEFSDVTIKISGSAEPLPSVSPLPAGELALRPGQELRSFAARDHVLISSRFEAPENGARHVLNLTVRAPQSVVARTAPSVGGMLGNVEVLATKMAGRNVELKLAIPGAAEAIVSLNYDATAIVDAPAEEPMSEAPVLPPRTHAAVA